LGLLTNDAVAEVRSRAADSECSACICGRARFRFTVRVGFAATERRAGRDRQTDRQRERERNIVESVERRAYACSRDSDNTIETHRSRVRTKEMWWMRSNQRIAAVSDEELAHLTLRVEAERCETSKQARMATS
jgi:hypothetical protein